MNQKYMYALGYFDGVHAGHAALLQTCRQLARETGCGCGAVTFTGHPEALLRGKAPGLINTPEDRKKLLTGQYDMDTVVELVFDKTMMQTPWQDFLRHLTENHNACGFVCGSDFRFGCRGEGTAEHLQAYCREKQLPCRVVEQQKIDGIRVSSTHIRLLLEQGKVEEAARFLGHPHILSGTVQPGKQLGRTVGMPTANIAYPDCLLQLPYGVYACRATVEGKTYNALTNVGKRPTVCGESVTAESWLLDFSGDLYGKTLTLSFYAFIRPEQKFPDLEQLRRQVENDKFIVEKILPKP